MSPYDAGVLANDLELARYFETAAKDARKPKNIANWILNDLQSALSANHRTISECPIAPAALDELVNLIDNGKISGNQGKEVFAEMFASGKSAAAIVKEKGIEQLSDTGAIEALCDQVIAANPKPAADFKAGNAASLNFLKGQVMKLSKGKANPQLVERKLLGQRNANKVTRMRILIAPDKFKDSLSARQVAANIEIGLREVIPNAQIKIVPVADGGEGTASVISDSLNGTWVECPAHDSLGQRNRERIMPGWKATSLR